MGPLKTDELYVEVSTLLPDTIILIERIGEENLDYVLLVTEIQPIEHDLTLVAGYKENGQSRKIIFDSGSSVRIVEDVV